MLRRHRGYFTLEPRDCPAYCQLKYGHWDVIAAHNAQTFFLASRLAPRFGVLADMHYSEPKQVLPSLRWNRLDQPYYTFLFRRFAATAEAITTASQGIVDQHRRVFGIEAGLDVNATSSFDLTVESIRHRFASSTVVARHLNVASIYLFRLF
jgi:hypothetical protein